MTLRSVSASFEPGRRRTYRAKEWVIQAYESLFRGKGGESDVVLADLAEFCGYYRITDFAASSDELRFNEGKRAAFAHILQHLTLSPEARHALEVAARHEASVTETEGPL